MNSMLNKQGGIIRTRKKIVERIEEIWMTFNLHDIWKVKNPTKKAFRSLKNLHLSFTDYVIGSFQKHFKTWLKM